MTVKNDSSPPAAQVSQWRRLWTILLAPHPPRDEKSSSVEKIESAKSSGQQQPQTRTNKTDEVMTDE